MNSKLLFLGCLFFLFSCSTSHEVVSNNRIQKRKYNKGYHFKKHIKVTNDINNANVISDRTGNLVVDQILNSKLKSNWNFS